MKIVASLCFLGIHRLRKCFGGAGILAVCLPLALFSPLALAQQVDAPAPAEAPGETPPPPEIHHPAAEALAEAEKLKPLVEDLRRSMRRDDLNDQDLNELRDMAQQLSAKAQDIQAKLQPHIDEVRARLDHLGPAPAPGQPAEADVNANDRRNLNQRLSQLLKPVSMAEDMKWEATSTLERINRQRRILFASRLINRVSSPVSPALWRNVADEARVGYAKLTAMAGIWWRDFFGERAFYTAIAASGIIWLALSAIALFGANRARRWTLAEPPPFWRRAGSAAWVVLFTALPPIVTAVSFYVVSRSLIQIDANLDKLIRAGVFAVSVIAAVNAIAMTLLAPGKPEWRIFNASTRVARRIRLLSVGMATVFGADLIMSALNEVLAAPLVLAIAQSAVASAAFAVLGLLLFLTPSHGVEIEGAQQFRWLRFLRFPFAAVAFTILACALIGYVALARFLAAQIVVTGTVLVILYLSFMAIDALTESLKDESSSAGRWLATQIGLDEQRRGQIALPLMLILKVIAFAAAVPIVMLQVGFDWNDVNTLLRQAFFGFQIGGLRISLASAAAALVVFLIAYTLARLFEEWLDDQVLAKAGVSGSARDSIRTGIGYIGLIVAGVLAFSSAGVNFSNLALVAGALSVGVGLGLQSIVNNFVSGLILLAERPIRVGDWVQVGEDEGIVRRISVRATEVETFDRASVVIPNSTLIAGKVKNWTLHNDMGRVTLPISVSSDCDPAHVKSILERVARENMEVLATPAPIVYFENFTATSLDFKLYVYLLNLGRSVTVKTELRMAILRAFKEEGVAIPQSQLDLFLKDIQGIASDVLGQIAAQATARATVKRLE